jgi:hypothetical protein
MITEKLIKLAFNFRMKRYAKMLKLDINSEDKTIDLTVLLKGEASPIEIHIGHYEVLTDEMQGIKISNIHTSREWMTELIQAIVPERTIPFNRAKLLKIVL